MFEAFARSLGWYPAIHCVAAQVNRDLIGIISSPGEMADKVF
jgi:hypothetical protein